MENSKFAIIAVVLAIASPSWAWDPPRGQMPADMPAIPGDDSVMRPLQYTMDKCWPSGHSRRLDPFEDQEAFSCMLRFGYRYCRDCISTQQKRCVQQDWAPYDRFCWESTTFPAPHLRGELP